MPLEDLIGPDRYINNLNRDWPEGTDYREEGDNHMRGMKNVQKNSWPKISGACTASHTELSYTAGVTSPIQGQLDNKSDSDHTHTEYAPIVHTHPEFPIIDAALVDHENRIAALEAGGGGGGGPPLVKQHTWTEIAVFELAPPLGDTTSYWEECPGSAIVLPDNFTTGLVRIDASINLACVSYGAQSNNAWHPVMGVDIGIRIGGQELTGGVPEATTHYFQYALSLTARSPGSAYAPYNNSITGCVSLSEVVPMAAGEVLTVWGRQAAGTTVSPGTPPGGPAWWGHVNFEGYRSSILIQEVTLGS